jgi:hypothetical protein
MKALSRIAAAGLMALAGTTGVSAQDGTGAPVSGEIYIENVAPQPLTFGLSPDNASWERFTLGPDQVAVYGGGPDWYFLILTEGVELRYRLDDAGSYRLYWNEEDLRWDMMTCQEPACGRLGEQP